MPGKPNQQQRDSQLKMFVVIFTKLNISIFYFKMTLCFENEPHFFLKGEKSFYVEPNETFKLTQLICPLGKKRQ